jgi:Putative transposase/Transposase zinc-binding domain
VVFQYLEHHLLAVAAKTPPKSGAQYARHRPEQTALYQLVQQHAATFFAQAQDATGSSLPRYVKDEFDSFLSCGILAHGFLRLHCGGCKQDQLLAFSCKRRGFCPSCGAKRMSETAAYLVDHVIPTVPVRQWVLSLPIALRVLLAAQPNLVTTVLQVVQRKILRHLLQQANLSPNQAQGGSVTLIQRFGSAANLNIHLHCLVLDGVYQIKPNGELAFIQTPAPTDQALQLLLRSIITGIMKRLVRQGVLVQEQDEWYVADTVADDGDTSALRPLQQGSIVYRIAFGPRAGRKVLTLREALPIDTEAGYESKPLCVNEQGFSLHAAVRCGANERLKLERLCRYITRPALANERVKINAKGQVELKLKTPWRDGTTHHVLSPLEFMQRLAALVPRPRLHLIRFHGVLAPNAKWRSKVVPQLSDDSKSSNATPTATDSQEPPAHGRPMRLGWAKLLKRVFSLDLTHCPHCGGDLRIVAAILQRQAIDKILNHLGLDPQPPPRAPARGQMTF